MTTPQPIDDSRDSPSTANLPVAYAAARRALAEAVRIDEIKTVRDLAVAAMAYAQVAQDFDMLNNAVEIREEAERKAGGKLIEMRERGERQPQTGDHRSSNSALLGPRLADLKITKIQSSRWQAKARMPEEKFQQHLAMAQRRAARAGHTTTEQKQQRRAERVIQLAKATKASSEQLGKKLYSVIYADPPWRFEPYSRETGMDRAADNHYPTMPVAEIMALKVPAADDAVLFLWATVPMLPEALNVMGAWGFTYKSHFVWMKNQAGTGYWNRNKHELLLVGTKGDIPAPAPGEQYESVITAMLDEHSTKPAAFAEIIEDTFPYLTRLEMFAREPRLGWDTWGNEVQDVT